MLDIRQVCEECQRIEHATYCSQHARNKEIVRDIRDCSTWGDDGGLPCDGCSACIGNSSELQLLRNHEGLTFGEWCLAAFVTSHDDIAEVQHAWMTGEDPTEWRDK